MGRGPKVALAFIGAAFLVCCGGVAWYNAPWEAPDEPEHVQNVQTLVDGRWYRIGEADGIESHQPPLYYLAVAGWQKAIDLPARAPRPVALGFHPCRPNVCPLYEHDLERDDADARRVRALRVPSVLMGLLTIGLTALAARRLSDDRWTPVVAAALMASVPRFAFVSASVNNDVLVILCGAAMLALLASTVRERRRGLEDAVRVALVGGAVLGLAMLAKLYGLVLALPLAVGLWSLLRRRGRWRADAFRVAGAAVIGFLAVSGWWLVMNQVRYGDPLGASRARAFLRREIGLGYPRGYGFARILVVDLPKRFYETFFYNSAFGRFLLPAAWVIALAGLARREPDRRSDDGLALLAAFVVSGLLALGFVAVQTATFRVATAYIGLPALACLAALGLERGTRHVGLRFVPAVLGALVAFVALRLDVIAIYA